MREAIVKGTITAKAGAIGVDANGNGGWIINANKIDSSATANTHILRLNATYYTT